METIGSQKIWSFLDGESEAEAATNSTIRHNKGHFVNRFVDLAQKVAELQFRNRDHILLFRGQSLDHLNQEENSTLKPTLFRSGAFEQNPGPEILRWRFETLKRAADILVSRYRGGELLGRDRLERHRVLQWSILQHYGVCGTPLLDVTQSLRIAASFASEGAQDNAFVFVVGVPNLSGAVTVSAEAGLQIVRLSSACPPSAMRPHFQEGYLLGEYPEISEFPQKANYRHHEIDAGRRLVAKFRFSPSTFWTSQTFPRVGQNALYPTGTRDPLESLMSELKSQFADEIL